MVESLRCGDVAAAFLKGENQLQKRQARATVADFKSANKAVTAIKNSPNEVLRIRPLTNNMAVMGRPRHVRLRPPLDL